MKEDESMSSYISRVKVIANNLNEAGSEVKMKTWLASKIYVFC